MGKVTIVIFVTAIIILALCSCSVLSNKSIWEKDDLSLFEYIFEKLSDKSDFGSDLSSLNDKEKVFMSMALLEQEVNNGGFEQFFFNTRGQYNDSLIDALTAVNASETKEICAKALDIISQGLLKDQESDLLDKECDTPFYDKSENLTSLIAEYARKNRDSLLS